MHHRTLTPTFAVPPPLAAHGRALASELGRAAPCAELRQQPRATAATATSRPRARCGSAAAPPPRRRRRRGRRGRPPVGRAYPGEPPHGRRPSPRRVTEAIRAFCTTFRRDAREMKFVLASRRSNFVHVFPEIRPLDRRFLRSVAILFCGANFVSLYLLHRSSVWRATSSGAKLIAWRCLLA
ncbi:uncharacterized protein M6B38_412525 [Iris pallida]|uniref:Uncharacterized protein n=1 Tax=Iris pallida TaxID=29817 RepID=A0AAX6FMY9_IRIPA|nr:uncharacterized protein M6B38_412525 [Iris pallida]